MPAAHPRHPTVTPSGAGSVARAGEALLWILGTGLLGWCGVTYLEAGAYQRTEERLLEALRRDHGRAEASGSPRVATARAGSGLIGRLEIPRLRIGAIVREGAAAEALALAVGHVEGTALPGQDGNVCLAAHRDTFFRRLEGVELDDAVRIVTPEATYDYIVEDIAIVRPEEVEVLAPTAEPTLTLVTCYPFRYVGPAPRRFVVRARQVSPAVVGAARSR